MKPTPRTSPALIASNSSNATLEAIAQRLREAGIALHLSEVKGPVMDRLQDTAFMHELTGKEYLTHYRAIAALTPEVLAAAQG